MLKALIQNDNNTLLLDIPYSRTEIAEQLGSIGVWNPQCDIFICDKVDNKISVKLFADSNLGNRLLSLFDKNTSLSTVNTVCDVLSCLPEEQLDEIHYELAHGEYNNVKELLIAVKNLTPQTITTNFYCPLTIQTNDEDSYDLVECENSIAVPYEDDIRKALMKDMARGNGADMATYFSGRKSAQDKLISIKWDVAYVGQELYGCIHVETKSPLTDDEKEEIRSFCSSQNSDGFGEGFEQRPLETEDGDLYISFWQGGDNYFVYDDEEFKNYITGGMNMGGIE